MGLERLAFSLDTNLVGGNVSGSIQSWSHLHHQPMQQKSFYRCVSTCLIHDIRNFQNFKRCYQTASKDSSPALTKEQRYVAIEWQKPGNTTGDNNLLIIEYFCMEHHSLWFWITSLGWTCTTTQKNKDMQEWNIIAWN